MDNPNKRVTNKLTSKIKKKINKIWSTFYVEGKRKCEKIAYTKWSQIWEKRFEGDEREMEVWLVMFVIVSSNW